MFKRSIAVLALALSSTAVLADDDAHQYSALSASGLFYKDDTLDGYSLLVQYRHKLDEQLFIPSEMAYLSNNNFNFSQLRLGSGLGIMLFEQGPHVFEGEVGYAFQSTQLQYSDTDLDNNEHLLTLGANYRYYYQPGIEAHLQGRFAYPVAADIENSNGTLGLTAMGLLHPPKDNSVGVGLRFDLLTQLNKDEDNTLATQIGLFVRFLFSTPERIKL